MEHIRHGCIPDQANNPRAHMADLGMTVQMLDTVVDLFLSDYGRGLAGELIMNVQCSCTPFCTLHGSLGS